MSSPSRSAISASSAAQTGDHRRAFLRRVRLDARRAADCRGSRARRRWRRTSSASSSAGRTAAAASFSSAIEVGGARRPALRRAPPRPSPAAATIRCASLSPARAGFSYFAMLLLDGGEVGERELGVDRLDVGDRIRPCRRRGRRCRPRSSARRARSRRSRGCWRGTGCRGPRPSTRRRRVPRCRRTRRSPESPSPACAIAASAARRGSGTSTMPTLGSIVQNG